MNYSELSKIIVKAWLNTQDIMKIANCGRNTATKLRNIISINLKSKGKLLPQSSPMVVPTKELLEHLGLNENYIFNMALKEKEIVKGDE